MKDHARTLLARVAEHDGVEAFSEAFMKGLTNGQHEHIAISLDDDPQALAAIAAIAPDGSAELAVHPDYRRRGIGSDLAKQVLARRGDAGLWAHGNLPAAQALAASLDLRPTRELLVMSIEGEALRAIGAPGATADALRGYPGLRENSYADEVGKRGEGIVDKQWLAVNNEAFDWHPEQGGWDIARLHEGMNTDWFDPHGVRFVWEGERLAGFHWTKRHPGQAELGEVYVVGVADAYRGRGLGDPLMRAGVEHLVAGGAEKVILYVEADNAPAVARYETLGFSVTERHVVYSM